VKEGHDVILRGSRCFEPILGVLHKSIHDFTPRRRRKGVQPRGGVRREIEHGCSGNQRAEGFLDRIQVPLDGRVGVLRAAYVPKQPFVFRTGQGVAAGLLPRGAAQRLDQAGAAAPDPVVAAMAARRFVFPPDDALAAENRD